jgi:hypothetical protein
VIARPAGPKSRRACHPVEAVVVFWQLYEAPMRTEPTAAIQLALMVLVAVIGCSGQPASLDLPELPRSRILETAPMHIDQIYTSMTGPYDRVRVDVSDIDWITGFEAHVVDAETGEPMGDEFFCHSQLQLPNTARLLVNATGIESLQFPSGFGMPVRKIIEPLGPEQSQLFLLGMLLNNHVSEIDRLAKVRWRVQYWRDDDPAAADLKTLFRVGLDMTVEDLEAYESEQVPEDVTTHCVLVKDNTTHWLVPPGPQTTRKVYRDFIPVEATVHYGVVHLHNHGMYMKLTDLTTGEVLWRTDAVYEPERRQIDSIPTYSSTEGFVVYPDREYEIEAFYENTTDHDVDAMAMMYLYYHPKGDEIITYPVSPPLDTTGS